MKTFTVFIATLMKNDGGVEHLCTNLYAPAMAALYRKTNNWIDENFEDALHDHFNPNSFKFITEEDESPEYWTNIFHKKKLIIKEHGGSYFSIESIDEITIVLDEEGTIITIE